VPLSCRQFFLLLLLLYIACSYQGWADQKNPSALAFKVEIRGDLASGIKKLLTEVSETKDPDALPPRSMAHLKSRVEADLDKFNTVMRSSGYYAATIDYRIEKNPGDQIVILFDIMPGPPFLIEEVKYRNINSEAGEPDLTLPPPEEIGLVKGERIESRNVINAKSELRESIRKQGYPFPDVILDDLIIDHGVKRARVILGYDPGPDMVFGNHVVLGLDRVKQEYIKQLIPWGAGDSFSPSRLNELRRRLIDTGLFSLIDLRLMKDEAEGNKLPVRIDLRERDLRSIRMGGRYETDRGIEVNLGWRHRNLRGSGEDLNLSAAMSRDEQHHRLEYRIPYFRRIENTLNIEGGYREENTDAYENRSLYLKGALERQLHRNLTIEFGVGYRLAELDNFQKTTDKGLLFFPAAISWDSSDDPLDPGRGFKTDLLIIPFVDTLETESWFVKTYARISHYLEIVPEKKAIWANRFAIGNIGVESKSKVPLDERFYAGGSGTIRGYGYQTVGPMRNGLPTGGLAILNLSSELRFRLGGSSGAAVFVDGGQVYDDIESDFGQSLKWGGGIGYRYFSDFGPIRVDLAFPLYPRDDVDDPFFLYISIGQAF